MTSRLEAKKARIVPAFRSLGGALMIKERSLWLASKVVRWLMMGLLVSGLGAQVSETRPAFGYPEDWTHHHIKFTLPGLRQHPEIFSREPRAIHQIYRQWRAYRTPVASVSAATLGTSSESHSDWNMSLGTGTEAFGQFPAKWTTNPDATPSCANDYVVFTLNVAGPTNQATLVGFNNLYSGTPAASSLCNRTTPTVKFAYYPNSQFHGQNSSSPVLSLDGTKVAFVETHFPESGNSSATSWLHVLTLGTTGDNGTVTAAVTPGGGTPANNASQVSFIYASATNTRSSPWVDYDSDTLYVGADNGTLYVVHPVFTGTPMVQKSIAVGGTVILTSPVFDNTTGNLYVGGNGGALYVVNVNSGAVSSLAVGSGTPNNGIYDSPTFDSTGQRVLAISANGVNRQGSGKSAVVVQAQANATGTSLSQVARVNVGLGASGGDASVTLYMGDFDNAYFTNPATGHMLVCGTGPTNTTPYRYLLNFNAAGIIQPGTSAQIVNNVSARCGPVTDYFNPNVGGAGGTDFLMWGVTTSNCGLGGAGLGCVLSLQNETTLKGVISRGGASGIIIDNDSTAGQASSIYFSTEVAAPSGNYSAVKLGQLNLN